MTEPEVEPEVEPEKWYSSYAGMVRDLAADIAARQHYVLPIHQGMSLSIGGVFAGIARAGESWGLYATGAVGGAKFGRGFDGRCQVPWCRPDVHEVVVFAKSKRMHSALKGNLPGGGGMSGGAWADEQDILLPAVESWAMLEARFMFPALFVDALNLDNWGSFLPGGMSAEEYLPGLDERMAGVKWEVPSPEGG